VPAAFFSLKVVVLEQTFIFTVAPTGIDELELEETVPLILNSIVGEGQAVPPFVAVAV
jgi:hypothetical protein